MRKSVSVAAFVRSLQYTRSKSLALGGFQNIRVHGVKLCAGVGVIKYLSDSVLAPRAALSHAGQIGALGINMN